MTKSKSFERKIKDENIDITRIMKVDNNKTENEFGKKYTEKEHHGKWRKRFIQL